MHSKSDIVISLRHTFRAFRSFWVGAILSITLVSARAQTSASTYVFSHLTGSIGGPGSTDGIGPAARFHSPNSTAVDGAGNVYVADANNHTIRKITPAGVVTTLAGTAGVKGSADGSGSAARFNSPDGIAVDGAGNVFVADMNNNTIRKIAPGGVVTTLAGTAGIQGSADGTGAAARFYFPRGIAVDGAGTVYVADSYNNTIRKITSGGVVTTFAGTAGVYGRADGTGPAAEFDYPEGIAVDSVGNVYVSELGNNTIRKITPGGSTSTLAGGWTYFLSGVHGGGSVDGTGTGARFNYPRAVAVDGTGTVYVADSSNHTIRRITPTGVVTTFAGTAGIVGSADGTGPSAQFYLPNGVAADNTGTVYVADTYNDVIRRISSVGVVTTLAGMASVQGSADGAGSAAQFVHPSGTAVDKVGNIYVTDEINHTIRKISSNGSVITLAGTAGIRGSADGTGPAAQFNYPNGIAVDGTGTIYVADSVNHTIRKITAGGVVTTLAGTAGVQGSADGAGAAARFNYPQGIALDGAGTIYVVESGNQTIRKIDSAGAVTTLAGMALTKGSTDGAGPAARFNYPYGIAVDNLGNVYVADTYNHTIRKITAGGVVTTLAGTAGVQGSIDGTGPAARFNYPQAMAVDGTGTVYVADSGNHMIRKITAGGAVITVAGVANLLGGEDGMDSAARFNSPGGIAVDSAGAVYVADSGNNAIRKGVLAVAPVITTQPQSQTVVPGGSVQFSVVAGAFPAPTYQWFFNGSAFSGATTNSLSFTSARNADAGDYTVVVTNALGSVTSAKATLAVSAALVTPPPAAPASGGGGSVQAWFVLVLFSLAGLSRCAKRKPSFSG